MRTIRVMVAIALLSYVSASSSLAQTATSASTPKGISQEVRERCPTVIVYQRGVADSFAPGTDPVYPSLALDAFLLGAALPGHANVVYDDVSNCDHHFGDTFKLDACVFCCGICSATLEITLRGCGSGADCNDSITVGQAPFTAGGGGGYVLWNGYINSTGCPGGGTIGVADPPPVDRMPSTASRASSGNPLPTIVKTIQLDPRRLAELVCERHVTTIDVYIQDDQIIDSMRLIITKP